MIDKASATPESFSSDDPSLETIDVLLNQFSYEFARQVQETKDTNRTTYEEYVLKKAEGLQSFYEAGVAFAVFLCVVFLFIIIKIERNLRAMVPQE